MDGEKNQEIKKIDKIVWITTMILVGYTIGKYDSTKVAVESYRKGVSDTLASLIVTES